MARQYFGYNPVDENKQNNNSVDNQFNQDKLKDPQPKYRGYNPVGQNQNNFNNINQNYNQQSSNFVQPQVNTSQQNNHNYYNQNYNKSNINTYNQQNNNLSYNQPTNYQQNYQINNNLFYNEAKQLYLNKLSVITFVPRILYILLIPIILIILDRFEATLHAKYILGVIGGFIFLVEPTCFSLYTHYINEKRRLKNNNLVGGRKKIKSSNILANILVNSKSRGAVIYIFITIVLSVFAFLWDDFMPQMYEGILGFCVFLIFTIDGIFINYVKKKIIQENLHNGQYQLVSDVVDSSVALIHSSGQFSKKHYEMNYVTFKNSYLCYKAENLNLKSGDNVILTITKILKVNTIVNVQKI